MTALRRWSLAHLREDDHSLDLYADNLLYETGESTTVDVAVPGRDAVKKVNVWTGESRQHDNTRIQNGNTILMITLVPGETAWFIVDRARAGVDTPPAHVVKLTIALDSWDAGDDVHIAEDRGLGYVRKEVRPSSPPSNAPSSARTGWKFQSASSGRIRAAQPVTAFTALTASSAMRPPDQASSTTPA